MGKVLEEGGEGQCELEEGPWLAADTARRICCDASWVPLIEGVGGEALDVGRKRRTISPAMDRALRARDGGCRFPGCTRRRFVDGHHIKHWVDGGETKLSNLVQLCRTHHRLVHEGGFRVSRSDEGQFVFTRPGGRVMDGAKRRGLETTDGADSLRRQNRALGLTIDHDTCVPTLTGLPPDYYEAGQILSDLSS